MILTVKLNTEHDEIEDVTHLGHPRSCLIGQLHSIIRTVFRMMYTKRLTIAEQIVLELEIQINKVNLTDSLPLNSGLPSNSSARIHPIDQTSTVTS